MSNSEKLMNFMHFHNSSTRNRDHHILLIMTGDAHRKSCHKLSLILVRKQGLYIIKTDRSGKIVIAFTINEKNYLMVSLFCLIWLRCWSCFWHCDKSCYCLYIQFYKLLWLSFYVDFFLNLRSYYNDVEYRHK